MTKYILSLVLLLTILSCDRYLDIIPKGEKIPITTKDYRELMNYAYLQIADYAQKTDIRTDDFTYRLEANTSPTYDDNYYWSSAFGVFSAEFNYSNFYQAIFLTEEIANKVSKLEDNTENKQLIGEAWAARGFCYFALLNLYAPPYDAATEQSDLAVPLVLKHNAEQQDYPRANVKQVYDHIFECFQKAEAFLQVEHYTDDPKRYRFSKATLYGLLARMYLYRGQWDQALEYVEKSLNFNAALEDWSPPVEKDDEGTVTSHLNYPVGYFSKEVAWALFPPDTQYVDVFNASDSLLELFDRDGDARFSLIFFDRSKKERAEAKKKL